MRTSSLIASITLATTLLAGGTLIAAPVLAQALNNPTNTTRGPVLTIKQIYDRVEAAGYGDIREIEREDNHYEVEATAADGRRAELYIDLVSGEITKTKFKDAKRDN